jgi:hypothetical protein
MAQSQLRRSWPSLLQTWSMVLVGTNFSDQVRPLTWGSFQWNSLSVPLLHPSAGGMMSTWVILAEQSMDFPPPFGGEFWITVAHDAIRQSVQLYHFLQKYWSQLQSSRLPIDGYGMYHGCESADYDPYVVITILFREGTNKVHSNRLPGPSRHWYCVVNQ